MDTSIDRTIAERAASQLGLLSRRQAREAGITAKALAARCQRGSLIRLGRQVYGVAGLGLGPERRVLAACLDVDGVASHRSAAWLHGLDGFDRPWRPDVTTGKGRAANRTGLARVHVSTNLAAEDVVQVGSIPTTSVARTFLDLSKLVLHGELRRQALVGAIEAAVRTGAATDRWLWWILEERRCRGRDGVSVMEEVLAERADLGPTESWLERELLRLLRAAGLPLPTVQRRFAHRGAFVSRVDFAYDDCPVVIEVEGKAHRAPAQAEVDARQRDELQLLGLTTLTFTYRQVVDDPAWVVDSVRRARALRLAA